LREGLAGGYSTPSLRHHSVDYAKLLFSYFLVESSPRLSFLILSLFNPTQRFFKWKLEYFPDSKEAVDFSWLDVKARDSLPVFLMIAK
jgi:hypothetical protein